MQQILVQGLVNHGDNLNVPLWKITDDLDAARSFVSSKILEPARDLGYCSINDATGLLDGFCDDYDVDISSGIGPTPITVKMLVDSLLVIVLLIGTV